jgi:branched-chain amino acid aminotransferase
MSAKSDNPFGQGLAYLDDEFVPLADARIPLVEAGFMHSDATYDVAAVWDGRFFRLDEHLRRFATSYGRLRMKPPLEGSALHSVLLELAGRAELREAFVAMIATRGVPQADIRDPRLSANRLYLFACPYVWVFGPEVQERGVRAVVSSRIRTPPRSFDPTIKNFQWGDLVGGIWDALDAGAEGCILLDADNNVTEGAGYNVFAIVNGVLRTPGEGALLGITRQTVLDLAEEIGFPANVGPLGISELRAAEEVFFTSTAGGVMPVGTLDGEPVSGGGPGARSLEFKKLYWEAHYRPGWTTEVNYGVAKRPRESVTTGTLSRELP